MTDPREPLAARIAAVEECRKLFGKQAARALWRDLGLPMPAARDRPAGRPDLISGRLDDFIHDRIEPATAFISFRSIRASQRSWCEREGTTLTSECALALALTAHGNAKYKRAGRMMYGAAREPDREAQRAHPVCRDAGERDLQQAPARERANSAFTHAPLPIDGGLVVPDRTSAEQTAHVR